MNIDFVAVEAAMLEDSMMSHENALLHINFFRVSNNWKNTTKKVNLEVIVDGPTLDYTKILPEVMTIKILWRQSTNMYGVKLVSKMSKISAWQLKKE